MRIALCVKQVPVKSDAGMNPDTGSMIRTGKMMMNPNDLLAVEFALKVQGYIETTIDVFTMGPEKAKSVLTYCLEYGMNAGYLVSDKHFAGADVLATSYTLAEAIKSKGEYDLILCGKQTTDGDTSFVSGAISKWMGFGFFNGVQDSFKADDTSIIIQQIVGHQSYIWNVSYPCVLAITEGCLVPRIPKLRTKLEARKKEITWITMDDLQERLFCGTKGSVTKVCRIYHPEQVKRAQGYYVDEVKGADYIYQLLK